MTSKELKAYLKQRTKELNDEARSIRMKKTEIEGMKTILSTFERSMNPADFDLWIGRLPEFLRGRINGFMASPVYRDVTTPNMDELAKLIGELEKEV